MKVNGIIAEYNPFHNGHKYQLNLSKEQTSADYTVIVMSGNFVQRGAPALTEKHVRAEMALREGADLVLELPSIFATASAEYFATAAVTLLNRLGVVTHLSFGSESGNMDCLQQIAHILVNEPSEFKTKLQDYLRQGYSFPAAREASLTQYLNQESLQQIIKSPNNILAVEYLRALLKQHSPIIPFTVTRMGMGYHDTFSEAADGTPNTLSFGSASAIRSLLQQDGDFSLLNQEMPAHALSLLKKQIEKKACVYPDDASSILLYKLLSEYETGYEKYMDVTPDLSNRIRNNLNHYTGFQEFCDLLKTKELTHTRISRCLMHILLNITSQEFSHAVSIGYVPYAKVLGFRKDSLALLTAIRQNTSIPLITKLADADKILNPEASHMLLRDIQISSIYQSLQPNKIIAAYKNEYSTPIVII